MKKLVVVMAAAIMAASLASLSLPYPDRWNPRAMTMVAHGIAYAAMALEGYVIWRHAGKRELNRPLRVVAALFLFAACMGMGSILLEQQVGHPLST